MEVANSFSGFFYNLIPGLIFLLFNSIYYSELIKEKFPSLFEFNLNSTLQVLVISLFIGFFFQGITKLWRKQSLNETVMEEIEKEESLLYKEAVNFLSVALSSVKKNRSHEDIKRNLYLMHNYTVAMNPIILPEFFSSRFALWSNIFIGSLISLILMIFIRPKTPFSEPLVLDVVLLLIFTKFAYKISKEYIYSLYDSVLRTFTTIVKIPVKQNNLTS